MLPIHINHQVFQILLEKYECRSRLYGLFWPYNPTVVGLSSLSGASGWTKQTIATGRSLISCSPPYPQSWIPTYTPLYHLFLSSTISACPPAPNPIQRLQPTAFRTGLSLGASRPSHSSALTPMPFHILPAKPLEIAPFWASAWTPTPFSNSGLLSPTLSFLTINPKARVSPHLQDPSPAPILQFPPAPVSQPPPPRYLLSSSPFFSPCLFPLATGSRIPARVLKRPRPGSRFSPSPRAAAPSATRVSPTRSSPASPSGFPPRSPLGIGVRAAPDYISQKAVRLGAEVGKVANWEG